MLLLLLLWLLLMLWLTNRRKRERVSSCGFIIYKRAQVVRINTTYCYSTDRGNKADTVRAVVKDARSSFQQVTDRDKGHTELGTVEALAESLRQTL